MRKSAAKQHHWTLGSAVAVEFASTGKRTFRVVGIYDRTGGYIDGEYIISQRAQGRYDGTRLDSSALVLLDQGAERNAVQAGIKSALRDHPDAKVLTPGEYEDSVSGTVDQLLIFVTVMLLLAVVLMIIVALNRLVDLRREL